MPRNILIAGAGIAGLACAISLSKELGFSSPDLKISVFEGAAGPSASGGAISLTPIAQNYLHELGVLSELNRMGNDAGIEVDIIELFSLRSGRRLGPLRFTDEKGRGYGGYKGRRVMRSALSCAMLAVIRDLPNVSVSYDAKVVGGSTTDDSVTLKFENGAIATGDLLLGCDGVHSITRTQIVDPGNRSEYTGISFIQSVVDAQQFTLPMHFDQTAVHFTRHSSLLTSYCDPAREKLFAAAILRVNEHLIERYQAASTNPQSAASMKMSIRYLVRTQFGKSTLPSIRELVDRIEDWALYPVYQVRQRGKWYKGRVLLLGDAAHAMPPRDESAAYAIEDALIFTQILAQHRDDSCPLSTLFQEYEAARRVLVNKAFDASRRLWQSDLDKGLFPGHVRDLMSPVHVSSATSSAPRGTAATHESFSDLSVYSLTREFQGEIES
ncbi:FAD/NAD(P)-binding domain-containing protein [Aspergillus japonicus CBS 114.51]|uniref:FAD/NAD(P)-binding domain-containing protein n=2 Tax=Aspergillus TaxID=5052 RepID=A0A2V5H007_ASPV1|nr:FAD/NAD(P)-binding domain-containing protein [Aspergillus japonicus CBS 114.51]PYI15022.1 FAD/NAD(P)-binding domain-containing protein [Aspergillus violaceofuscus CBS 115571]RAH82282.1 FAD/NAD(P)-binding domain-containing protein [Aspergillus japonicus CBS 114.51]